MQCFHGLYSCYGCSQGFNHSRVKEAYLDVFKTGVQMALGTDGMEGFETRKQKTPQTMIVIMSIVIITKIYL